MAETNILRGVRHQGKVYLPGNAAHEEELSKLLTKEDAKRLQEKEYLGEDFKASGKKQEIDPNAVDQRTVGQRLQDKQNLVRDEGAARPQGVEKDEDGEPQREVVPPPATDEAALKEVGGEEGETKSAKKSGKAAPNPFAKKD